MHSQSSLFRPPRYVATLLAVCVFVSGCGQFSFSNSAALEKAKQSTIVLSSLQVTSSASQFDLGAMNAATPVTVTTVGSNNLSMAVSSALGLGVSLSGFTTASASIYALKADGTCGLQILNGIVIVPNGSDHVSFCVQPLTNTPPAGASPSAPVVLSLKASAPGLTAGSINLSIHPVPTRLKFTSPITSVDSAVCSAGISLAVQDYTGTTLSVAFPAVTATLSGTANAYLNSSCTGPAISGPIQLSNPTTLIYLNPQSLNAITLQVASSLLGIAGDTKTLTINSVPSRLKFVAQPNNVSVGVLATTAAQVQVQNFLGNAQSVSAPLSIILTLSAGQASFYTSTVPGALSVNSITVPAGSNSAQFYIKPTALGTLTIRASATVNGTALAYDEITYSVAQSVAAVQITSPSGNSPEALTAGIASGAFTIILKDGMGNEYCPSASALTIWATPSAPLMAVICRTLPCNAGSTSATSWSTNGSTRYPFYLYSDASSTSLTESVTITIVDSGNIDATASFPLTVTRTPLAPDTQFRLGGQEAIPFSADMTNNSEILAATTAVSNSIVAVGYKGNNSARDVAMAKFFGTNSASAGLPDTAFNANGRYEFSLQVASFSYGVAVVPLLFSGYERYLVGIQTRGADFDFALARVCGSHSDPACPGGAGTSLLDPNFTPGGTTGQNVYAMTGNQMLKAMAVSPTTGNIYLVGSTDNTAGGDTDVLILALKSDGTPLSVLTLDLAGASSDDVFSALITRGSDGAERLTIGAVSSTTLAYNTVLLRYKTASGLVLDSGFGTGGKVTVPYTAAETAQPAALLAQGTSMIVAVNHTSATVNGEIILMRFREAGTRDTTLGGGNQSVLPVPANQAQRATGMAVNPTDGDIYLAGTGSGGGDESFLAWRLTSAALIPEVVGNNTGTYTFGNVTLNHTNGLVIDGNKPLLFGEAFVGTANNFALMSLLR